MGGLAISSRRARLTLSRSARCRTRCRPSRSRWWRCVTISISLSAPNMWDRSSQTALGAVPQTERSSGSLRMVLWHGLKRRNSWRPLSMLQVRGQRTTMVTCSRALPALPLHARTSSDAMALPCSPPQLFRTSSAPLRTRMVSGSSTLSRALMAALASTLYAGLRRIVLRHQGCLLLVLLFLQALPPLPPRPSFPFAPPCQTQRQLPLLH